MASDDVRSRVAKSAFSENAPLPTSALGRGARLFAGLARGGAKSLGRSVRRSVGRDASDVEPEAEVVASLGQLKGLTMKMGQVLGYVDIGLPDALRSALSALHTNAQPLDAARIRTVLDDDLGDAGRELARAMRPEPLSAASVGQVYRSELPDGTPVAVKVLHRGLAAVIERDFGPAMFASRISSPLHAILGEVRQRLLEECDYELEARRQTRFGEIYAGHETIVVPEVHRAYSSARVLTTTFKVGVHLDAYLASSPSQQEKTRAGEALFDFYVASLFKHGLYNCDPHPGNYLFMPDGRIAIVDFGCTREFEPGFIGLLASLLAAIMAGDLHRMHRALIALGVDAQAVYDRAATLRLLQAFCGPFVHDEVGAFHLDAEVTVREMLRSAWKARRLAVSGELLFLLRTFLGLSSVLARLEARSNWRRRLESVVAQPATSVAGQARAFEAGAGPAGGDHAVLVAQPPSRSPARARPAETRWDIVLVDAGASPIALIRELRELMGVQLRELEGLVDSVPQTLRQGVSRAEAETVRLRLETVGARVEVRRASASA